MKKEDIQILSEIYTLVYEKFDVGERWTPKTAEKLISYWFKLQPDMSFVAECDGKIVGAFLAGIRPWWDGNHLVDGELFVSPDFQKLGIGTELSKKMYKIALEKYDVVSFDTFTFNTSFPLNWYKKQGFKENKDWVCIEADLKEVLNNLKNKN